MFGNSAQLSHLLNEAMVLNVLAVLGRCGKEREGSGRIPFFVRACVDQLSRQLHRASVVSEGAIAAAERVPGELVDEEHLRVQPVGGAPLRRDELVLSGGLDHSLKVPAR